MNKTSISWTQSDDGREGATWNPTFGCKVVSPGCANCYAMRMAGRFSGPGKPYEGLVTIAKNKRAIWTGNGHLSLDALAKPLHWRSPRRVFVNSMSDLFFERFTNDEIAAVFGVMAACPQHTFQCLTKRSKRMREWFQWVSSDGRASRGDIGGWCNARARDALQEHHKGYVVGANTHVWPLPNVWLGVSSENQATAEERIPDLLHTPAAIRFISAEPLLGPLDLTCIGMFRGDPMSALEDQVGYVERPALDWVIVGCESGPGARPCDYRWVRSVRDQCRRARVAFFLKQARCAIENGPGISDGPVRRAPNVVVSGGSGSKKKGGGIFELPYLDGLQHKSFPKVHHGI